MLIKKQSLIIRLIIFIEIIIIILLTSKLIKKKSQNINILGETSINYIPLQNVKFNPTTNLKYFYEPNPNQVQVVKKNWLPYSPIYTINEDSLNERFNYSIEKQNKTYRIITIGDSFTFGQNVSTEKNWTELLEDKLNRELLCKNISKFEVINLGVYGYDTQYSVERFKLRGKKYNPDLVIWTFADYERILEKMTPLINKLKSEAEKLESKSIYYQNWQIARENLLEEIKETGFAMFLREQFNLFNNIYKGNLLVISFPHKDVYINTIKELSISRPKTYFFQSPIRWEEKQYFLPDNHLNDLGHQKIAENILNYLIKNKIIPCN